MNRERLSGRRRIRVAALAALTVAVGLPAAAVLGVPHVPGASTPAAHAATPSPGVDSSSPGAALPAAVMSSGTSTSTNSGRQLQSAAAPAPLFVACHNSLWGQGIYSGGSTTKAITWKGSVFCIGDIPVDVSGSTEIPGVVTGPPFGPQPMIGSSTLTYPSLTVGGTYALHFHVTLAASGGNGWEPANGVTTGCSGWGTLTLTCDLVQTITVPSTNTTVPDPGEELGDGNASEPFRQPDGPDTTGGDPVNSFNGNFSRSFNDLTVSGRGKALALTRTYNSLASGTDGPFGHGWSSSYGMSLAIGAGNTPVTVTQENGSQVKFTLSGSTYTAGPQVAATLVRNGDGTYTFTRRAREIFTFDSTGRLTAERDLNGYTTTIAYPSTSQTVVTDPAGRTLTFSYTSGRITSVTDSATPARKVTYAYSAAGDLTDVVDAGLGHTQFTYDSVHRLLTMRSPRFFGDTTTTPTPVLSNHYDSAGRVDSQTDPLGRTTSFDYTSIPDATKITDPNGNVTVSVFLPTSRPNSIVHGYGSPSSATWKFTYGNSTLNLASVSDPNGHVVSRTFDSSGNTLSLKQVDLNRTWNFTYDTLNDTKSVTDPMSVATTFQYDSAGNLLSRSTPLTSTGQTRTTSFTYDPAHPGDVTTVTDPNGKPWNFSYDSYGNLSSATDPVGDRTTFTYDTVGRRLSQVAPRGNVTGGNPAAFTTTYAYDAFGDPTLVKDPLGHQTTADYDRDRNLFHVTDPDTHKTTYSYDAAEELTAVTRADTPATQLKYSYDGAGNVITQLDGASQPTTYAYDALNRLSSVTDPLSRTTTYSYDGVGNVVSQQDPGGNCAASPRVGCTTRTYDAANKLTAVTFSDSATPSITSIAYDADGRRTSMTDGTGQSSWTWDSLGRLTQSTNGANQTTSYVYDLKGQLTSITYPGTAGHVVNRFYDDAGRLKTVGDWLTHTTTFNYDPDSFITSELYPNATSATFTPDNADRLMAISDKKGTSSFASFTYGRDNADLLTSSTPTGVIEPATTDTYTPLNQLKTVNGASYGFDAADNLTALPSGTQSFDVANELTSASRGPNISTFAYDTRGNRTSLQSATTPSQTFTYDQANRLTKVAPTGAGVRMAAGDSHALSVKGDGTVWAWGSNTSGQLGDGTLTKRTSPVQVPGLAGGVAVAGGSLHSLALKSDGTVWAWGDNGQGRLGDGTTTQHTTPIQVSGLTGVTGLSAGTDFSLALKSDGTVWGWGANTNGQLGDGTTNKHLTPNKVLNLTNVVAIAAGASHSLALKSDGTVWAWGLNSGGQLGDGTVTTRTSPVKVSALTGVTAIAAGTNFSLAVLKADGSVRGWGKNGNGQLGDGTTTQRNTPVQASGITGVTSLDGGDTHTIARTSDGSVWTWGNNANGELGDGTVTTRRTPGKVANLVGAATVAAGLNWSSQSKSDGTASAWGANASGQLGNGTTTEVHVPITVNSYPAMPATLGTYTYDGFGMRASKTAGGVTQRFAWDMAEALPALLYDGSTSYVYGPGGTPLEQIDSAGNVLYFHQDQLGSTRLLTDATGAVAATYSYDAFGTPTAKTGTASTAFGFAGQYTDAETGLQYLRARYYDPGTAQFLSRDPIAPLTQQPYSYAAGSPLDATDPMGLSPTESIEHSAEKNAPSISDSIGGKPPGPPEPPPAPSSAEPPPEPGAEPSAPAPTAEETGWTLPEEGGGAEINGRWYTEHALERMAPDTPQVWAELEARALARAEAAGLEPGTPEFQEWWNSYGPDPRGIPPSVVEAEIANPGSTNVRVITGPNGEVITVIPR